MRPIRSILLAVALAAVPVASPAKPPPTLTAEEQAQLQHNLDRGAELYRYDQSAWHVTDAALAAIPDSAKQVMRGYITTPAANGLKTTFFGQDGGRYFAVYSAAWTGSTIAEAKLYPPEQHVAVTAEEQRLIEARQVAIDGMGSLAMCSSATPNLIVIPGAGPDDPISVYVLTPQTKSGVYPLGGHHRIDVKDGKVVAKRDFTKSCIDFDRGSVPKDGRPEAAVITHLLDPIPTEIHVFTVYAMRLPLYVMTKRGAFAVEVSDGQPRIRILDVD